MARILIISDLHLGDKRNPLEHEQKLLRSLAALIAREKYQSVLNLGDTVSRKEFLRNPLGTMDEFAKYKSWRDALHVPFRECAIYRERPFFTRFFNQTADSVWDGIPGLRIITLSPEDVEDHNMLPRQWRWLLDRLDDAGDRVILIGSHVPYPGSCDRPVAPGIYLAVPSEIHEKLVHHHHRVFWTGGHFHWKDDPPLVEGSLTAFIGGRFAFAGDTTRDTYLREVNLDDCSVRTIKGIEMDEMPGADDKMRG